MDMLQRRLSRNLVYFKSNYLLISLILMVYLLVTNLILLLAIVFCSTSLLFL